MNPLTLQLASYLKKISPFLLCLILLFSLSLEVIVASTATTPTAEAFSGKPRVFVPPTSSGSASRSKEAKIEIRRTPRRAIIIKKPDATITLSEGSTPELSFVHEEKSEPEAFEFRTEEYNYQKGAEFEVSIDHAFQLVKKGETTKIEGSDEIRLAVYPIDKRSKSLGIEFSPNALVFNCKEATDGTGSPAPASTHILGGISGKKKMTLSFTLVKSIPRDINGVFLAKIGICIPYEDRSKILTIGGTDSAYNKVTLTLTSTNAAE